MKVQVSQIGEYIPKWQGNQELDETEQIVVNFTNLSFDVRRKFEPRRSFRVLIPNVYNVKGNEIDKAIDEALTPDGEMTGSMPDFAGMVRMMKPTFRNLEDQDGNPITTWAELLKLPVTKENHIGDLIEEIELELPKTQEPPDSKN